MFVIADDPSIDDRDSTLPGASLADAQAERLDQLLDELMDEIRETTRVLKEKRSEPPSGEG